ncbi:nuclear protein [Cryptococcus neoformans var. grubii Br795]|nr:nuclear protein [Cryptococcus neoformans var. grubii Br795]
MSPSGGRGTQGCISLRYSIETDNSPVGAHGQLRPAKRVKVATACENCKTRKVGCDGSHPCHRCIQDQRTCTYAQKEARSALTRARMTELEDRISAYERIWNAVLEEYPIQQAYDDAVGYGMSLAIDKARMLRLPKSQSHVNHSYRLPTTISPPSPDFSFNRTEPRTSAIRLSSPTALISLPPTRMPSIEPESEPLQSTSDEVEGSYEWKEAAKQVPGQANLQSDAGMASLTYSGKGASYLGLSSGATFLNAIRRLSPQAVAELSPNGAFITSGSLVMGGCSNALQGLNPNPAEQQVVLPSAVKTKSLVESYFRYFHPLTPLVHEPTIRAQISGAVPIVKPGSDVLMYMIFAMGALDLAHSEEDDDGHEYYETARQSMDREILEGGTLPLVQGLAIMANYLQRNNRPNAGYLCLGMAIRMATALGLHTPAAGKKCSALEKEMRIRVWWSLVALEAGCAVTFGRPHSVGPFQLAAIPLPLNVDDEYLTVSTTVQPKSCDRPTLYTALIVQAELAKVTCGIHDRILQSHPAPTVEQVKRYNERVVSVLQARSNILQVEQNGPYQLARRIQIWRTNDFRAVLHRPILLAAAWDTSHRKILLPGVREAIEACRVLALENLEDIGSFVSTQPNHQRGTEWYTLYFAFQASLTLLLSIVWEPHHTNATQWRSVLTSTALWFRQIQSMKRLALAYASVLESVVGKLPPLEVIDALIRAVGDTSSSSQSNLGIMPNPVTDQGSADILDFERYWMELWDNDTSTSNLGWSVDDNTQNGWQF